MERPKKHTRTPGVWRLLLLGLTPCLVGTTGQQPAPAQPSQYAQQPAPVSLEKITDRVYRVKGGSGANGAVIIGRRETMVIDAKMNEDTARQMLAEIEKISPSPIGILVLTHSDGDHVNGITGFPERMKILAHERTKKDLEEAFKDERQRAYLPRIETVGLSPREIDLGGQNVRLLFFGPAHTSGDLVVFCPREKVAVVGDLIFVGRDPLVHRHKNGHSFGLAKVLKDILKLEAEVFLSGHADKAGRQDVEAMLAALEEKQNQVRAMVEAGKGLEEVKAFYKIEDRPTPPGRTRFLSLPEVIFLELTENKSN